MVSFTRLFTDILFHYRGFIKRSIFIIIGGYTVLVNATALSYGSTESCV